MKIKIKDREAMRIRKRLRKWEKKRRALEPVRPERRRSTLGLILTIASLPSGCATYTPNVRIPPRLVLPELATLRAQEIDLDAYPIEPLCPSSSTPLAELDADAAARERANPEREAKAAMADLEMQKFLEGWEWY